MEQQPVTTIQCQNLTCLAPNAITNKFCEKCGTPLVKRYLWVSGDWVKTFYRVGELIDDRYLVKQPQIVLDTKPALAPQALDEFPSSILPYLKLFSYRLHVPQVYGYVPTHDERLNMDIWLLEYGSIPTDSLGELLYPHLLPQLTEVWADASDLRQLHWLWQMARLWQPFQSKGVASSLLNPTLLRVNGRIVQLLELELDSEQTPSLEQLGQLWSRWLPQTSANLRSFLEPLCQDLQEGIGHVEPLVTLLDRALLHYGQATRRTYQIFTCTDTGPMREHNEDACYPPSEQAITLEAQNYPLAIVCDGIGGQEGGEIASNLAIETLHEEITRCTNSVDWEREVYYRTLEETICITNDAIAQRNDSENRQERQRMGTTLVMSLAHAHEMYVAHVGDSRVYWITLTSCHQLTVDDDLASREVRLGYLLYRDAVQYPNAGALVQALGMSNATTLHPTVQRFVLDEDCVFLLCSDGLSDYDRVEQYWESEIVPLLSGEKAIAEVGKRLLDIANQKNGHDNSTIALVYCQVRPQATEVEPLTYIPIEETSSTANAPLLEEFQPDGQEVTLSEMPTEPSLQTAQTVSVPAPFPARRSSLPLLLGGLGLVVLGLLGVYGWRQYNQSSTSPIDPTPAIVPPTTSPEGLTFKSGDVLKVTSEIQLQESLDPPSSNQTLAVPPNRLITILGQSSDATSIDVAVCSSAAEKPNRGWIGIEQLKSSTITIEPTLAEKQACQTPSPTPSSPAATTSPTPSPTGS